MTGELRRNEYAALKVVCNWKVNKQILVGRIDNRLLNIANNTARLKNRYSAGGLVILRERAGLLDNILCTGNQPEEKLLWYVDILKSFWFSKAVKLYLG